MAPAEETLRYKVVIDEGSLMSEMARARGTISSALQQGIGAGQYAYNNIQADMSVAQRMISGPPAVPLASPTSELGFFRSMIAATGAPPPNNMLTYDYQRLGQMEFQSRLFDVSSGVGRQAIPMALGFAANAALGGGAKGLIGDLAMTAIAAPVVGAVYDNLQAKNDANILLNITRAPNAMREFSKEQRAELTGGLLEDVAKDIRFGVGDLNKLLAGGQSIGAFQGTTNVEDFRNRFRNMLDQVKTITRVFQQTQEEAMRTLGDLSSVGMETRPGEMQGRIVGIRSLTRFSDLTPQQATRSFLEGGQIMAAQGGPMAAGAEARNRYNSIANAAINTNVIDPNIARQMGGVEGVGRFLQQGDLQLAQTRPIVEMLAGMANEGMTDLDPDKVSRVASGQIDFQELIEKRGEVLANPEKNQLFRANLKKMQNTVATSGATTKLMREYSKWLSVQRGITPEVALQGIFQEAGLDPMQQQVEMDILRNSDRLDPIVAGQREVSAMELAREKQIEDSRLSRRIGRFFGGMTAGITNSIGTPIADITSKVVDWGLPTLGFASGLFTMGIGTVATAGYELWKHGAEIDVSLGRLFGGGLPEDTEGSGGKPRSSFEGIRDRVSGIGGVEDGVLRDRLTVSKMAIDRGFLSAGHATIGQRELSTLKKLAETKGQRNFIEDLEKMAMTSEKHEVSADKLYSSLMGKDFGQYPSRTPSPGSGLDTSKWDHVAVSLDQLRGATDSLRVASEALLRSSQAERAKNAGKN